MKPAFAPHDLDVELVFDRVLSDGDLDDLQDLLVTLAPRWAAAARIWWSARDQVPIDVRRKGSLAAAVAADGRTPVPGQRRLRSVEIRGAGPELTLVVNVDSLVVSARGARRHLGNEVVVQVRRRRVEGQEGPVWTRATFERLCAELVPAWAAAYAPDEYWAKVMADGPGVEAVGRDFGRFLPGVFWLNFFGPPYVEMLGEDAVLGAPGARRVGAGVVVPLAGEPADWDTGLRRSQEHEVKDRLGPDLFFARGAPAGHGRVPTWT